MRPFEAVTVIIPVMDETLSLKRVLEIISIDAGKDIREFIVVVCDKTTKESLAVCEKLKTTFGGRLVLHNQKILPYMGGAVREAFERAKGSHAVVVFADAESDPGTVKILIEQARQHPDAIISASRWLPGGGFEGYGRLKLILNRLGQRMISFLYGTNLTDYTFGFKLFPLSVVRSIRWEELRNSFSLESTLKPLRLGVKFVEVPSLWKRRGEGASHFSFFRYWRFAWITVKIRFFKRL